MALAPQRADLHRHSCQRVGLTLAKTLTQAADCLPKKYPGLNGVLRLNTGGCRKRPFAPARQPAKRLSFNLRIIVNFNCYNFNSIPIACTYVRVLG